jgi:tetratricopeptide (TPR) repeat protein
VRFTAVAVVMVISLLKYVLIDKFIYAFLRCLSRGMVRLGIGHFARHRLNQFIAMREIKRKIWRWLFIFAAVPAVVIAAEAQNAFNEGVKFYKAAKYKEAVAAFNRAIKAAPKSDDAYNNRGLAYFKLGQIDVAVKDYEIDRRVF